MSREQIDRFMGKWASRKLTVFAVATVALFTGHVNDTNWMIIATVYISLEGATRIVERLKEKQN